MGTSSVAKVLSNRVNCTNYYRKTCFIFYIEENTNGKGINSGIKPPDISEFEPPEISPI